MKKRESVVRGRSGDEPAREAWMLLLGLLRAEQHYLLQAWTEFDISSAQGDLLCSLEPGNAVTMVSLARSLHCHDSNVTGLVDKLEERGLVKRLSKAEDRRVKLIGLTAAGEKFRERLLRRLSDPLPFIAQLPLSDQVQLREIMQKAAERAGK